MNKALLVLSFMEQFDSEKEQKKKVLSFFPSKGAITARYDTSSQVSSLIHTHTYRERERETHTLMLARERERESEKRVVVR